MRPADDQARSAASVSSSIDGKLQALEEGLEYLKWCVTEALRYGGTMQNAADLLDEEWAK